MTTSATKMFLPSIEGNKLTPVLVTSNLHEVGHAKLAQAVTEVFATLTEDAKSIDGLQDFVSNLSSEAISSGTINIDLTFSDKKVLAMESTASQPSVPMSALKDAVMLQVLRIKANANSAAIETALIKKNKLKEKEGQEVILEFAIRAYIHETILTVAQDSNNQEHSVFVGTDFDLVTEPTDTVAEEKVAGQDGEMGNIGTENIASPSIQAMPPMQDSIFESGQHSTNVIGASIAKTSSSISNDVSKSVGADNINKPTITKTATEQKNPQQNDVPITQKPTFKHSLNTSVDAENNLPTKKVQRIKTGNNSGGSQVKPPISPKFTKKQNNTEVETLKPFKLWTSNRPPEKFSPDYDAYQRMERRFDGLEDKGIEQDADLLIEPKLQKNRALSGRNSVKKRSNVEKEPQVESDQINDSTTVGTNNRNNRNKKGKQAMAETNTQQDNLTLSTHSQVMANLATSQSQKKINGLSLINRPDYSLNIEDRVNTSKDGVVKTKEIVYKESHPFGNVVIKLTEEHYQGVRPDYNYGPFLSKPGEVVEATEKITGSSKSELINLEAKAAPYRFKSEVAAESLAPVEKAKVMERFHQALNELEQHKIKNAIKDIDNASAKQPLLLKDQLMAVQEQLNGSSKQQDAIRNLVVDNVNAVASNRKQSLDDGEPTL